MRSMVEGANAARQRSTVRPLHRLRRSPSPAEAGEDPPYSIVTAMPSFSTVLSAVAPGSFLNSS